jgi:hypothetical protein
MNQQDALFTIYSINKPVHVSSRLAAHRVDQPDDEQQACSKHVQAYY